MAQINLLKQPPSHAPVALSKIFAWLAGLVLLAVIAYAGYSFYQLTQIKAKSLDVQAEIDKDKMEALAVPNRDEILTRQVQLKSLNDLISKHIYWSQLFPQLAQVTLKKASYSSMRVGTDNNITLSGSVPSPQDMDLYLQVFDTPQVYKYFNNVRISSYAKSQDKNSTVIKFQATIQYDPSLVQYVKPVSN